MVKALFDTNILIDYLRGIPAAREELGRFSDKAISIITWMEVLAGTTEPTERATRDFLEGFTLIPLDPPRSPSSGACHRSSPAPSVEIAGCHRLGFRPGA